MATLIAALERLTARVVHPGHPLGRINDSIVVTAVVVIAYVVLSRRGTGATFGERLFDVDYRSLISRRTRCRGGRTGPGEPETAHLPTVRGQSDRTDQGSVPDSPSETAHADASRRRRDAAEN